MGTEFIFLLVSGFTVVYTLLKDALSARGDRKVAEAVERKEKSLIERLESEAPSAEARQITWEGLPDGDAHDNELQAYVSSLATRVTRMETVSERLEVRRQALLETYHNQGLSQSRVSFGFSITLGVLGFAIIAYAVLTKSPEIGAYVSGVVTEAVAALFFTQSNQSRELMARFFDKLRDDRRLEEALALADGISDSRLKSTLQALLAMQLIGSEHSPSVLPGFNSVDSASQNANSPNTALSNVAAATENGATPSMATD
ncbi:hypothetical protein [Streptomyces sp. SID13031]|uniref:TRADD-N-associated membrane domain-containing protein n=1 Tax=Streptomyces sp. SID13031 TaxID=2706046 RepID=UPI0013C7C4D2|nr:hypothetical protein [Streptomyces sp. SID13031]NEA32021.1 hypothetical protein [Streptomyces sp. SID13031]